MPCIAAVLLAGCNPGAIPTVIFPAKPEVAIPETEPLPVLPEIHTATLNIFARDIVNPDRDGVASPVQIRVYLSNDSTAFDTVSFEQLFGYSGTEFSIKPEFMYTMKPGSVESLDIEIVNDLKVIAVAAAFQDIGRSSWIERVKIEDSKPTNLNFILTDYAITHERNE